MVSRQKIDPKTGMTLLLGNDQIYDMESLDLLIDDFNMVARHSAMGPIRQKLASNCEIAIRIWQLALRGEFSDSSVTDAITNA